MEKMQRLSVIWVLMVGTIVITLMFIGKTYNKKLKQYSAYENKLAKACEKYVKKNELYPEKEELKVKQSTLVKEKYIKDTKVNKNKCDGYVIVSKEDEMYTYKAYIDCGKYKTEKVK